MRSEPYCCACGTVECRCGAESAGGHLTACCRWCGSSLGGQHLSLCQVVGRRPGLVVESAVRLMTASESLLLSRPLRERFRAACGCEDDGGSR
jgi:hypothetical protein